MELRNIIERTIKVWETIETKGKDDLLTDANIESLATRIELDVEDWVENWVSHNLKGKESHNPSFKDVIESIKSLKITIETEPR